MKRIVVLKLTRKEADAIMDAGNAGIADLIDAQDDKSLETAEIADTVLNRLGKVMTEAEWLD